MIHERALSDSDPHPHPLLSTSRNAHGRYEEASGVIPVTLGDIDPHVQPNKQRRRSVYILYIYLS